MDPPPAPSGGGGRGSRDRSCPGALVMSPTRELTTQIFEEARKFTFRTPIRPVVAYGGANIRDQATLHKHLTKLSIALITMASFRDLP